MKFADRSYNWLTPTVTIEITSILLTYARAHFSTGGRENLTDVSFSPHGKSDDSTHHMIHD
jgi:hypothetical protein